MHDKRPVKKINKKKEAGKHKPGHHLELNKQIFKNISDIGTKILPDFLVPISLQPNVVGL